MPRLRSVGLDTLRASAIALVFMYHYMCFVSGRPTFGVASVIGWSGVDLFFVLSGYLIANQLFAGLAQGQVLSASRFCARRALRTLPVFWLVLAAYLVWPGALGGREPPSVWRFLTFTQNLGLQAGTAFSHAWSLCVEEQFYVALPFLLWVVVALKRKGWLLTLMHGWWLLGALAVLGMICRAVEWWNIGGAHADGMEVMTFVYYATPCRFDEFLPGVALAMLKNFHPGLWGRITARGHLWMILGVLGLSGVWWEAFAEASPSEFGFFMTTFGYTLLSVSFGLLVLAALSPATYLYRLSIPGAESLALWSYSIYLSHRPLANVLKNALVPLGVSEGVLLLVIALACIAVGALLQQLVEAPIMRWRDRQVPSNFADSLPDTAGALPRTAQ